MKPTNEVCKVNWENFAFLCLGALDKEIDIVWEWISSGYSEPHRHYHTLEHIENCIVDVPILNSSGIDFDVNVVEMALWFHDIVYNTHSSSNEEDSAAMARNALGILKKGDDVFKHQVSNLILLTKHSSTDPVSPEEAVMLDIDLAILGAQEEEFDQYEINIRKEYEWVPYEIYCQKRIEILESFLARPRLYHTNHFHTLMDKIARRNLSRSIQFLKGQNK